MKEGPYIPHYFGEKVKALYRAHRGWLTCAVHHSIPWPEKDVLVHYDGEDYFLRGLREHEETVGSACITVRMSPGQDINDLLRKVYKFASILGWFKRGYVDVVGYISGSHLVLYSAAKQPFAPVIAGGKYGFNCNFMPIIKDDRTRKALAFWREGLKLERIHEGYSFLSFYKVIESQFRKGKDKRNWINTALPKLEGRAKERIKEIQDKNIDVGNHIFQSGRCAVAHASLGEDLIDPDIPEDRIRIQKDLVIIKALAEKYIREELGVPDEIDVYRNRDALKPIYEYLDESCINELRNSGSVPPTRLGLNNLRISVNHWPHESPQPLIDLLLSVVSAQNGLVILKAENDDKSIALSFVFNFPEMKASTNLDYSGYLPVEQGGEPENEIAFLEYQKAVIGNGIIELLFPNGQKVVCEVVIPVNIDIGRTFEAIDQRIKEISTEVERDTE